MQETLSWSPPEGPLGRLTRAAHVRAESLATSISELRARALDTRSPVSLVRALRSGDRVSVIAEVKRRSPSKGELNHDLRAADVAVLYARGGAAALSILTEPSEFGGSVVDIEDARAAVTLPILKKDFHVHVAQVWEARVLGASALLLIARALEPGALERLVDEALAADLEPVVEIRSTTELARALATPATAIGVNARDLETLRIDPDVPRRLLALVPRERIAIAESGIAGRGDVERVADWGADAVLVGSFLSTASDPLSELQALTTVERQSRGG